MELSGAQRDAHIDAARSLRRSAAQNLDRNLLFQIFDYLRDGRAFLQCEATCTDYRSLLREEAGIGQKLWQARPIAYGARLFATGGTAYTRQEWPAVNDQYLAGRVGWTERRNDEICDGGREVVLGFACMDAIGAAQRLGGAIITTLAGEQWTPLVNRLHRWDTRGVPPDMFSSDVVLAATESVEAWIIDLMEKAWLCALHRGSYTVADVDIRLAGRVLDDGTVRGVEFSGCDADKAQAIAGFPRGFVPLARADQRGVKQLAELLAELDVATQERIIRKLVRRAGFAAYDGLAYERFWRLILLRLYVLLERVDAVFMHALPREERWAMDDNKYAEGWEGWRSRPSLETLAHVLQNGSGPIDRPPPCDYYTQLVGDEDDGSFCSDDCPATDDDDDSSIGDESVSSAAPTCLADRLATLASLRASGALTEAEFTRAKAVELDRWARVRE